MKKQILAMTVALCLTLSLLPVHVLAFDMGKVEHYTTITAGENTSAVVCDDGTLYTWGYNGYGALGDGSSYNQHQPVKVLDNVCSINCGTFSMFALRADQSLWSWGMNSCGNLGGGITTTEQHTPVKVMEDVVAVSAGHSHTLAIKTDGTLWTWGSNSWGQLGDGSEEGSHISRVPVKIMDDVIAASAGDDYSMAIRSDHTLWAWGNNSNGQFGNGTAGNSVSLPTKVAENVIAVSCGNINYYTMIIRTDGSLWASGMNNWGELGNGPNASSNTFVKVMDNVKSVSAGGSFTLAIKDDGTLWGWGLNTYGQLGNGTNEMYNTNTPHMITSNVVSASAGRFHSIIKKDDGTIWTFGRNDNGQLGNGSTEDSNIPVCISNNIGGGNVDPVDPPEDTASSVHFFSGWNPTTRSVSFDGQSSPYYLATSIDPASVDALVGKYVLATVKTNPDSVLEIVNLQPVESSFGLVSSSGDQIITISGTEYPVSDNYSYLESYVGSEVLFHTYDGTIFGITPLQEKGGTLEHYDSGTDILTIDQKQYSIPYFVDISSDNVVTCLLQKVKFSCDNLNHIYRIELYDNSEENNPVPDFNVDIYRANWMQNSIPAVENINRVLRDETPSAELVSNLQETLFDEAIVAWDAFDQISSALDDPTALAEFAAEPKDMYAAIILNALEASVSYDIVDSKIEDTYKGIGKLISSIHDSMKVEWNIDIYNSTAFKNLSGEQRDQVVQETKSWFNENFSGDAAGLEFINQMFKGVTKGFDTIGSIEDWCERIVSCYIVADTNEYLKAVLRQVYKDSLQGNNLYLKLALADCVEIMDSSAEKLMLKLINDEITVIGLKAGRYVIKECWSQVKDFIVMEFPAIAVFQQAYKNAKYASNLLFSTDDTIEQYLNMVAVSDIETLVGSSVAKLNREFNQQKTASTAATYLTGMDFVFTLRDIDTQKAHGFADVLDNSWRNKIIEFLSGKDNFTDVKSYYRNRQVWYNIEHEKFLTGWVDYLEEDYPNTGLYAYYQHLLDESDKRILTKEFVAACPIDVYVYDQSGELAASIVDGRVSCFGDVMIALIDDTKVVRFYDNQDYRIEYVGTSAGEMDVTVTEFNTDEEVVRTVNYYDVALTDGKIYTIDADDTILNTTPYQLKDESTGKIVDYDYDSLLAKDSIKHTVSIQSGSMIQNGEILLSTEAVAGEKIEIISYVPERSTFDYWVSSNGDSIFANHTATSTTFIMPAEDIVIKAVIHGSSVIPSVYTITFDSNGGMTSATTITTGIDGRLPTLPTATRNSFIFAGWYTSPTGGEQITTDTIFSSDTTVYAHWAYSNDDTGYNTPSDPGNGWGSNSNNGSSNGNDIPHSLTLPSSVTGGKVTVSPQSAKKGDTVTITATPDSGYELAALAATDSNGNELELTNKGSGKYTFVMPCGKVTVDVIFQPIELPADSSASNWVNPFLDVRTSAWYYNAVRFASQSDLMNGVTATQFAPDANLSRAQLAQILYNKEGTPAVSGGSPFTDVATGTWYTNAVAWASAEGIVGGYGDGRFGPNDNITREQLVVMLWRYAEEPVASVELTFSDTSQISSFARPAICWAVENGILNGKGGNILDPKGFATRAEIAQMLKNYLDK